MRCSGIPEKQGRPRWGTARKRGRQLFAVVSSRKTGRSLPHVRAGREGGLPHLAASRRLFCRLPTRGIGASAQWPRPGRGVSEGGNVIFIDVISSCYLINFVPILRKMMAKQGKIVHRGGKWRGQWRGGWRGIGADYGQLKSSAGNGNGRQGGGMVWWPEKTMAE